MELIKMRVTNRYRGEESAQFQDGAVPVGAVIHVTPRRMRQLIADGNAAPIVGASETKHDPEAAAKKASGGTAGPVEPPSSLPAAPASPTPTASTSSGASDKTDGESSPSRTTSEDSPAPTSSTPATRASGTRRSTANPTSAS